jgi:hypothetical protein
MTNRQLFFQTGEKRRTTGGNRHIRRWPTSAPPTTPWGGRWTTGGCPARVKNKFRGGLAEVGGSSPKKTAAWTDSAQPRCPNVAA